jgi:peptide/nickel transport system permease protein
MSAPLFEPAGLEPAGLEPATPGTLLAADTTLLAGPPSRRAAGGWLSPGIAIPAGLLILTIGACFLWPLVYPVPKPVGGSVLDSGLPPFSPGHMLGTDPVGNDIFSRILFGGRVSFEVGFGTTGIGLMVGGLLGVIAAVSGGIIDAIVMRVLDVLIAFPSLVLALAIAEGLGPSELHVIWALSFFSVPAFGRVARAATLALREQTFMLAARLSGTKGWRIVLRHIVPNIMPRLMTFGLLGVGIAVILEGALSFLGLGIPPPAPSWGSMIAQGQGTMSASPYLVLIPSAFLFVTVVSLNLLGDALRRRWAIR